jgi:hypothetical protein
VFSFDSPQSVCLFIVCLSTFVLAFLHFKKRVGNNEPSLESRLRDVESRLAKNYDDAALHLVHAELLLRKAAPHTALESLERAFVHGMPKADLEPTFWACYDSITSYRDRDSSNLWRPGQKIWRRLCDEAPTLMPRIAIHISECETFYASRLDDATRAADKSIRQALVESDSSSIRTVI